MNGLPFGILNFNSRIVPLFNLSPKIWLAAVFLIGPLLFDFLFGLLKLYEIKELHKKILALFTSILVSGITLFFWSDILVLFNIKSPYINFGLMFSQNFIKLMVFFLIFASIYFLIILVLYIIGKTTGKLNQIVGFFSLAIAPPLEEYIFRYYIFTNMALIFKDPYAAIPITAILFALCFHHLFWFWGGQGWEGHHKYLSLFVVGIFLGFTALWFGIITAIIVHALFNIAGEFLSKGKEAV